MNNTDKLLRAFIEAQGYEIKEAPDFDYKKLTKAQAADYFKPKNMGYTSYRMLVTETAKKGCQGRYIVDDDGMYTERLVTPVIDYKVTKQKDKAKSIMQRLIDEIESDCNSPSYELLEEAREYIK